MKVYMIVSVLPDLDSFPPLPFWLAAKPGISIFSKDTFPPFHPLFLHWKVVSWKTPLVLYHQLPKLLAALVEFR